MALVGFGIKLGYRLYSAGSSAPFTDLGTLVKISPPKITAGKADAGTLAATFKPYLPTTPEGEGSFQIQFNPGEATVMYFRGLVSKAPIPAMTFKITYLDGSSDQFDAYPLTYEPDDIERENVMMASVTFVNLDAPTFNAAPSGGS